MERKFVTIRKMKSPLYPAVSVSKLLHTIGAAEKLRGSYIAYSSEYVACQTTAPHKNSACSIVP